MVIAAGAAFGFGACDFGQERPLNYQKGVYLGKPHQPLAEEQLASLRDRAAYQGGPSLGSSGPPPGGTARSAPVEASPPPPAVAPERSLRQRAAHQGRF